MFNMDAYVGVDVCGLSFMKGDQAHAGFPEAAYAGMAERLARAGHRVVVVEQVLGLCAGCVLCVLLCAVCAAAAVCLC
jgi:DNA mismatch repair ATPase MutS